MSVVGIDLGTTNTVVACVRSGRVHVIADANGQRLLPSVVSFHPNGEVLVGARAKERRGVDGKNTIASVKRLIGRSWQTEELAKARARFAFEMREGPGQGPLVVARGQEYTLPEISAFILKAARHIAEAAVSEPVERAVITVPAHFNELQRASTKVAGRVSGVEVLRILNEPTAAALAYGLGRNNNERIAVFDFGGGTFDCTLLDLSGNVFEVLASAGDTFLGGDDIDSAIAERMADAFLAQHRYDPREDPQAFERLRLAAEHIKIRLTTENATQVTLNDLAYGPGGTHLGFSFGFTRGDLDALSEPLVERAFRVTQEALALAQLTPTSFDHVILVGGSTRMPLVKRRVEAFFGSVPLDRVNPDEVVAIGAAIQAAALSDQLRRRSIPAAPSAAKKAVTEHLVSDIPERPPLPTFGDGNTLTESAGVHSRQTSPGNSAPVSRDVATDRMVPEPPSLPVNTQPMPTMSNTMSISSQPSTVVRPPGGVPSRSSGPPAMRPSVAPLPHRPSAPPASQPKPPEPPLPKGFGQLDTFDNVEASFPNPTDLPKPQLAGNTPSRGFDAFGAIDDLPSIHSSSGVTSPLNPFGPSPLGDARPLPPAPQPRTQRSSVPPNPLGATQVPFEDQFGPHTQPRPTERLPPPVGGYSMPPGVGTGARAPILVDVTPRALVVETAGGYCDTVIPRNAKIPCERTRQFTTGRDSQTIVRVRVAQGEHKQFLHNTYLGEVELSGIRPAVRGDVQIGVTFELDADGSLRVRAADLTTGQEAVATLQLVGLSTDEPSIISMIDRMARQPISREFS